jgi:hypothetical protein
VIRQQVRIACAGLALLTAASWPSPALATGVASQAPAVQARPAPPSPDGLTAAQAEQLFDRYVLAQARIALQLRPVQIEPFRRRLQDLQMVRRRGQRQRQQLLNQLNAASRGEEPADDAELSKQLGALDELTRTIDQQVSDARTRVEEILTPRQRVRFRIFEQRMEQRKAELVARARQAVREGRSTVPESR